MRLQYRDYRADPAAWADALGISRAAVELYLASEVVDLHVDSFIWTRVWGYDLTRRHGRGPTRARLFGHVDLPRLREAQVGGALWSITTNPWRGAAGRAQAFTDNHARLRAVLASCPDDVAVVRDAREYREARAAGRHGAFLAIQGANAVDRDLTAIEALPDDIVAATLVHLTSSRVGRTSSPLAHLSLASGLRRLGIELVRRLDAKRIFVDLAHIDREAFFTAAAEHDPTRPLIVTHTGVAGVYPHWRNLDDEQLRTVAESGGVVGIIFHSAFLGPGLGRGSAARIVEHLEHVVRVAGEDLPALGSDWDGLIVTPADMPTCLELPRLVELMLARGFSAELVRKILGGNFLRALGELRG